MEVRNLITTNSLSLEWWNELYSSFEDIIAHPNDYVSACRGKIMSSLFYEPSTRTAFSFQTAMMKLGGNVFGFSDPNASSHSKGETLKDTIKMCSAYADTIVIRHPREGAAMAASLYSEVPIINAGDGAHMHPTQTLTDLSTIRRKRGDCGNMNIGLCGDLKYSRTVHSLIIALSNFPKVNFYLISPRELALPQYIMDFLREKGQWYIEVTGLESTMPQLDVLYMTRIQRERFTSPRAYARNRGIYLLTKSKLSRAQKDLIILHPLPRVDEIAHDVDDDPRAMYFEQARYGMYIRMALLLKLCHLPHKLPDSVDVAKEQRCSNPACITQVEKYVPVITKKNGETLCCAYCDSTIR